MDIFTKAWKWLNTERQDLKPIEEPYLPEIRFDLGIFRIVYADIRRIQELAPPEPGNVTMGFCDYKNKEIWTNYKIVKQQPIPDFYNLGHELTHWHEHESGDYIDKIKRSKPK
jgi:hypothetical protein